MKQEKVNRVLLGSEVRSKSRTTQAGLGLQSTRQTGLKPVLSAGNVAEKRVVGWQGENLLPNP